jgi:quercetin dioxygenase-like cupin family protein
MNAEYNVLADLANQIETPRDGTLSRTIHQDDHLKAVLFAFSPGQELSEHTASTPAVLHFLSGEANVALGGDCVDARPGTWIHMPAQLPHSIRAKSATTMLLLLLKQLPAAK